MKQIRRALVATGAATVLTLSMAATPAAAAGHHDERGGKQLGKAAQACAYERGYSSLGEAFGSRPHSNMAGGVPAYLKRHCS